MSARAPAASRRSASRTRAASRRARARHRAGARAPLRASRIRRGDLVLRERPRREVDVRVGEAGDDDATAEVEDLGRRERRFVDADAACDAVACDRERALGRHLRVERADEAVFEDHGSVMIVRCSTTSRSMYPTSRRAARSTAKRSRSRGTCTSASAPRAARRSLVSGDRRQACSGHVCDARTTLTRWSGVAARVDLARWL